MKSTALTTREPERADSSGQDFAAFGQKNSHTSLKVVCHLKRLKRFTLLCLSLTAFFLLTTRAAPLEASAARECLDQARSSALEIQLTGDQSAALRDIALELVKLDPNAIQSIVAGIRRPSDAARCLGSAAVARAAGDPTGAAQDVTTAGRLLLRIANNDQRLAEQRLLLEETSSLGEAAVPAAPELDETEARLLVVLAQARRNPPAALALYKLWMLTGEASDRALGAITIGLSDANPDQALELASTITSSSIRDQSLWLIANKRPANEAAGIALLITDPLIQSAVLERAAVATSVEDFDTAVTTAKTVQIAPDSVLAEVAVAASVRDELRGLELARSLPPRPRAWALSRIGVELAATKPTLSLELLREAGSNPEAIALATARMAPLDPDRAIQSAQSLAKGPEKDAALALLIRTLPDSASDRAEELAWGIGSPAWQAFAVEPLALELAESDSDTATSLLGLVDDGERAGRIRAKVAAAAAAKNPALAARLLATLPPSSYRADACLNATMSVLGTGESPKTALRLGEIGLDPDLVLRWSLPSLAHSQTRSPISLSQDIKDPYRRASALVGVAFELSGDAARARPAPERAALIRPIVEWEGIQ